MSQAQSDFLICEDTLCGHRNLATATHCGRCGKELNGQSAVVRVLPSERSAAGAAIPPPPDVDAPPDVKDAYWYNHMYQGDRMPQLTVRSVLMGGVLGMVMAASNLYTTLAIGWAFGVAITACVMSYVIWTAFRAFSGGRLSQMSILENNCMQSTASAAGYSTGSTIATMFGALLMLAVIPEGKTAEDLKTWLVMNPWVVAIFTMCTGLMGVFLAIPLKRQMINHEQLRFPSGIAAAETLRNLYSESKSAIYRAYMLIFGIFAGLTTGVLNTDDATAEKVGVLKRMFDWFKTHLFTIQMPEDIPAEGFFKIAGKQIAAAFTFQPSLLLIGAGVITGMRASISMLIGAVLMFCFVGPWLVHQDMITPGSGWVAQDGSYVYDAATIKEGVVKNITLTGDGSTLRFTVWSLWGGTAVMVFASLTSLAVQWRTIVRAFRGVRAGAADSNSQEGRDARTAAQVRALEVPLGWMIAGMLPISIAMLFLQVIAFKISIIAGLIAIGMSFFLALVACRATGETDTTPIGAMGKVMQLLFAVLHPGQIIPNLAAAGIAANSASSSSDLLTDLKSGYLLGANPRKQFIAQFIGVFFGTVAIVPIWFLMVPSRADLEKFAAPATRQWVAVAQVLTKGIEMLPVSARYAILFGALVGIAIPILEKITPSSARRFLPSAMGLGLSWVIPFASALGFALGAVLGWIWEKLHPRTSQEYSIALASGCIAGESLMKAILAMTATTLKLLAKG